MARVFISYRRSDTQWVAGRLYDRLVELFGRENLFFDVSDIEPGEDFGVRITEIVGLCDVLLAVIGPSWVTVQDDSGKRRLDNSGDLIRIEIGTALKRNIRVIPILVDGAIMPKEHQLPADLAPLARRNAHDVSFARFHTDIDSFIRVLQKILAGPAGASRTMPQSEVARTDPRLVQTAATELPFTISLTTLGGVATPLIRKGSRLPAEASETFTTATDNQSLVEISLALGERTSAKDNVPVGKFSLDGIPPAPRGVPQIAIKTIVDAALILTVTAEDLATRHKQVLDALDLTRVHVPPEIQRESAEIPPAQESPRDSRVNLGQVAEDPKGFADFFSSLFGTSERGVDTMLSMTLSVAEAASGGEYTVELAGGRQISVRVPAGIRDGQKLRLAGLGETKGRSAPGDLYIHVHVAG